MHHNDKVALVQRLTQIGMALSSEKDPFRLLELILEEAKDIAQADGGTLYILDEETDTLEYTIVRNSSLEIAMGGTTGLKPPFRVVYLYDKETAVPNIGVQVVAAVLEQSTINVDDAYSCDNYNFEGTRTFDQKFGYRTQSVLTIPMINHRGKAIGCLQLINAKDPASGDTVAFSEETSTIVESLASQAAMVLDNKVLIDQQRKLLESFIEQMTKAIDAKSSHTGNHCERVPVLTNMLAEAACRAEEGIFSDFDMSDEERYELRIAGWLHDCGKIVTPVHVMDKATKLETIFDRIHMVQARFEVLKRDAKIRYLEAIQNDAADEVSLKRLYEYEVKQLEDDLDFLERINIGGEFMADDAINELERISKYAWEAGGRAQTLLNDDEKYNLAIRKGTITKEERQIMNDHMVHTVNMLEAMPWPPHLRNVPSIACGHHEKMDGTGYPKGILAGTMLPTARMMAVADIFEALTAEDRPYKRAKKLSEAMDIIGHLKKCNHLDPEIVDFFITSGVYKDYAKRFLKPFQIDVVDEQKILDIVPDEMHFRYAGDEPPAHDDVTE